MQRTTASVSPRLVGRRPVVLGSAVAACMAVLGGCGRGASDGPRPTATVDPPRTEDVVELGVDGPEFRPVVELASGSSANVTWTDLDTSTQIGTGLAPTLSTDGVRRVGMTVSSAGRPAYDEVVTLNLGFHRDDDYGRLSLPSTHEHDPQPVTALTGVGLLTGLVRLCAARTPLAGHLDLTGLASLEHLECYSAAVGSVDLTGCASLVRLVVEECLVTELDLNPVRGTLQDLRAAIGRGDGLTFAPLEGPMEALYHYCVREQPVHGLIPHAQLPVVEEYWVWGTGQRTCDAPTSPLLRSYLARDNPFEAASVDRVLVTLHALVTGEPGRVDLSGDTPDGVEAEGPSATGLAAAAALVDGGWRVSTN